MYKPASYKKACPTTRAFVCNGCGTKGIGGWFVPNTVYGLSILEACNIHDWMYWEGRTEYDKEFADWTFHQNMLEQIEQGHKWLKWLRKRRAKKYYLAVAAWGDSAFCKGKPVI